MGGSGGRAGNENLIPPVEKLTPPCEGWLDRLLMVVLPFIPGERY